MKLNIGQNLMIKHNQPYFGAKELKAAKKTISMGLVSQGVEVSKFETELCNFFGLPQGHAIVVSSGSSALYLALWALKAKKKKIALPVYSCSSLRNAVGMIGGRSIFVDCAKDSPNLDFEKLKKTKLDILIAPSMFGIPLIFPRYKKYRVIEDLSQALGAEFSGKKIGLRGEVGICSFYATKMITSGGQGGAIISKNKKIIDIIRDYREFDCRKDSKFRFNFQMTDLQASIGRVQLTRLSSFIKKRENWFKLYKKEGLDLLDCNSKLVKPVRYRIVLRTKNPKKVIKELGKSNINAIVPINQYELLDKSCSYKFAQELCRNTVSLPAHVGLKKSDILRISNIAKEFA